MHVHFSFFSTNYTSVLINHNRLERLVPQQFADQSQTCLLLWIVYGHCGANPGVGIAIIKPITLQVTAPEIKVFLQRYRC